MERYGFSKLITSLNDYVVEINDSVEWEEETKTQISSLKKTLETDSESLDEESKAEMNAQIETYELSLKYNINYIYYYNTYWKIEALSTISEAKYNAYLNTDKESNEELINKISKALENDDYSEYIKILKEEEKAKLDSSEITEEEYNENIYLLELREKYGIYKEESGIYQTWEETLYEDIALMKKALRTGIDTNTGKLLKLDEIQKYEDNIKIAEYRLENNIPSLDSSTSEIGMYEAFAPEFSMVMIAILMIIIAGSAISTEISKGTIKFLLFTPNKRWKVLLSKVISAILILVVLTIVISLLSIAIGNIFFEEERTTYLYISNGTVHEMSNTIYTVLYFLSDSIDILVYMLFALMLSTLTKNTALSVGVSIACYIGSGIIMSMLNYYITADWIKYVPFNNFGIADKIFANNLSLSTMQMASSYLTSTTVGFSLAVLGVCSILMIVTMFDSFNKADIH